MAEDLPYENTGTATVTAGQSAVVGQGTRWTRCRQGDTFFGRAGERNIVVSITDDTHLDLLFPATIAQAAQGVAVMRTPDDVFTQTLARSVFRKLDDSALLALSGLPPTARSGIRFDANKIAELFPLTDKAKQLLGVDLADNVLSILGAADYAAVRNLLGVALKQTAIDDATAGAGLTVGAFGLGGTVGQVIPQNDYNKALRTGIYAGGGSLSVNGPPGNSGYGPMLVMARTPGILSQLAGYGDTTSGASLHVRHTGDGGATWTTWRPVLPEYGSNANGQYVRFGDGTQFCIREVSMNVGASAVYADSGYVSWAANFYLAPFAVAAASGNFGNAYNVGALNGTTNTSVNVRAMNPYKDANTAGVAKVSVIGMGRWF